MHGKVLQRLTLSIVLIGVLRKAALRMAQPCGPAKPKKTTNNKTKTTKKHKNTQYHGNKQTLEKNENKQTSCRRPKKTMYIPFIKKKLSKEKKG